MTRYVMREGLSFCEAGGRLVFLDVRNDRYLRLPLALERTLVAYLSSETETDLDVGELITRGFLVEASAIPSYASEAAQEPARSAMELSPARATIRLLDIFEVLVIVLSTRLRLRFHPLHRVLDSLKRTPDQSADHRPTARAPQTQQILDAAARFRQIRLYIPVGMRCLIDSIAMARFLKRRNLDVQIVFGVAVDPFSAHCWVQAGDLVLNDTWGNVTSHVPIRVV